ncbi:MAG: alkaline phosphatase [Clostridia bacterium]|nr:alkaline phosphatase [Clostridia bacterium]
MKIQIKRILALAITAGVLWGCAVGIQATYAKPHHTAENVIMLIPDGSSIASTTLARLYQDGKPLAMDEIAAGLSKTYWSDGPITDSAPGGTALATGHKTYNAYVGVLPKKDGEKPVASVLEAAKLEGKATGLVVTSNIQHATPADFSAHYPDRGRYDILGEQQVYNRLDVVLGAGSQYLEKDKRRDKEDLVRVLKDKGYEYITTPQEMQSSKANKLWGMFDPDRLRRDFDRDPKKEPSLAEMTAKALEVLSKDKDGFFLMVEGSQIDWSAHAKDPVGVISDVLAFDKAVGVALDFAKKDGNTVVVAVSDHGTGGITIGDAGVDGDYYKIPFSRILDTLKKAKLTSEGTVSKFSPDRSNVREVVAEYYGIADLTAEEEKAIKEARDPNVPLVAAMRARCHIGWTTIGHTGEDVPMYVYAPKTVERLTGVVENTDIAKYVAKVMGVDLDKTTERLFVSAKPAYESKGATAELDVTDEQNPVFVVTKGSYVLKLSVNKNIAELNGKIIELPGVTVYNGTDVYVSKDAINLIK